LSLLSFPLVQELDPTPDLQDGQSVETAVCIDDSPDMCAVG